eukprot:192722_1
MYWFLTVAILISILVSNSCEPLYSIPLKFTANNEHFVTTMSFGLPITFYLDIIMDTGSGKFHIYNNKHNNISNNNIITYNTNSFQCICQTMNAKNKNDNSYLISLNDTWYDYQKIIINTSNNSGNIMNNESYKSFLPGCPLFNKTFCNIYGEQCMWTDVTIYYNDDDECSGSNNMDEYSNNTCQRETCSISNNGYSLIINGETVSFQCNENCYSGIDKISFKDIDIDIGIINYVPYVYADTIILNNKDHNISLFNNESWADGTLGLVYDYNQQTSFWQILGINEQHSLLLAFDSLKRKIDIGNISDIYINNGKNKIDYSENIWWNTDYHYFYIYSLSICNINLFNVLNIGSYYLAMIDTGAACLTLPPEIFDLLFKYIPSGFQCNANQTFCYISKDINDNEINNVNKFPMISFKLNLNNNTYDNSNVFYISLKDLILINDDDIYNKYCIEKGKNSINKIDKCTPDPQSSNSNSNSNSNNNNRDCTRSGIIIFGTKVLKSLYTILDYPNKRVGFANNKISNYTYDMYQTINNNVCNVIETNCIGDDILNLTENTCQSGLDKCSLYWAWTYDPITHYCVLQSWIYGVIPIVWIFIIIILLIFVKFKMWIDVNVQYTAIKV